MSPINGGKKLIVSVLSMVIISSFIFMETEAQILSSSSSTVTRTNVLQTINVSDLDSSIKSDYTVRVDPSNHFKKYRGGYNITNLHYWTSTIFTGVNGFAMGAIWFFFGVISGVTLLATSPTSHRAKPKKPSSLHRHFYLYSTLSAIFLTILAIVGCGLVLGWNNGFQSEAKSVVKIVMETANDASKTLKNTTEAVKNMRNSENSTFLSSTSEKLDDQAADIEIQSKKKRRLIENGLQILYIVITVSLSLNLLAVVALSVSGVLKLRRALFSFITICWFLTVLSWIFFGLYFFLNNFSSDTCTALENFQANPYNNSLSSILPCKELLSAKPVLTDVGAGIYDLINTVNKKISESYPDIALVCNPFSPAPEYRYRPDNCAANAIRIGDIPKVLESFKCSGESDNSGEACERETLISNTSIKTIEAYTSSIQGILNIYPEIEKLVECQTVKNAISEILKEHCPPLKTYIHKVWKAMVFLSAVMAVLVLIWTAKVYREERDYFSDGSVNPTMADRVEISDQV